MKVIKRNGAEVDFSREKIYKAIKSANEEVRSFDEKDAASDATINTIATRLYERCRKRTRATSVEEIQDMIETELMKEHAYETAKRYIRYRYWRSQVRQRRKVDLPEPEGPMTTTTSPFLISVLIPSRALISPPL